MSSTGEGRSDPRVEALRCVTKISRSPFFNFVRFNRRRKNFPNMRSAVRDSAQEWRAMSEEEKRPFFLEARSVPRNTTVPPYFMLGEHILGRQVRQQLENFKAAFERHLDRRVNRAMKKSAMHFRRTDGNA